MVNVGELKIEKSSITQYFSWFLPFDLIWFLTEFCTKFKCVSLDLAVMMLLMQR